MDGSQVDARGRRAYLLEPGYIYVSLSPSVVRAVVGSCVAVCLWDRRRTFGGMNHFLYPAAPSRAAATARYGNVAVAALVRLMEDSGSRRGDLVAQIYGGARPQGVAAVTSAPRT